MLATTGQGAQSPAIYLVARVQIASDGFERGPDRNGQMGDISILYRMDEHMWAIANCILFLTVLALGKVLYFKLLTLPSGSLVGVLWLGFLACSYTILDILNIHLRSIAPELMVFNCALLALPLTLFC